MQTKLRAKVTTKVARVSHRQLREIAIVAAVSCDDNFYCCGAEAGAGVAGVCTGVAAGVVGVCAAGGGSAAGWW